MRNRLFRVLPIYLALACIWPEQACAWKSGPPPWSTHRPISVEGISLLERNDNHYADITTNFKKDIADWSSGPDDDASAHGADSDDGWTGYGTIAAANFNGGPFGIWWNIAKSRYSIFRFDNGIQSAYYYIGLMVHLLEDQAAPPHAANVSHGLNDEIEYWEWFVAKTQPVGSNIWYWSSNTTKTPLGYYYDANYPSPSMIVQTQNQLTGWKYTDQTEHSEWRNMIYWKSPDMLNSARTKYIGAPGDTNWGAYGGPNGEDIYLHDHDIRDVVVFDPARYRLMQHGVA